MAVIKLKRGPQSNISGLTMSIGELAIATDTKLVYWYDGVGKNLIGRVISDLAANRPVAGISGRLYFESDYKNTWYDNGVYWDLVASSSCVNKNLIINGVGLVQQRSNYSVSNGVYGFGADRFAGNVTAPYGVCFGTFGAVKNSIIGKTGYAHRFSGITATSANSVISLRTRLEANDAICLKNSVASFSCVVLQDTGSNKNYAVYVRRAGSENDFSSVTEISNSGFVSIESGVGTQIKFEKIEMGNCSNGIEIEIVVNCGFVSSKNFDFTEIKLEFGGVCALYEYENYQNTLLRCLRYYYRITPAIVDNDNGFIGNGYAGSSTVGYITIPFFVPMFCAPNGVVTSSANNFRLNRRNTTATPTVISYYSGSCLNLVLRISSSGMSNGEGLMMRFNDVSTAYIELTGTEL